MNNATIYLSSFLLERNRWNGKGPSLLVSEWIEPAAEAGFQSLEIWAPHLFLSSRSEWELIRETSQNSDLPITYLLANLPTDSSDKSAKQRDFLIEAADYFDPQGIKFSVADGLSEKESDLEFLSAWSRDLPRDVFMLPVFDGPQQKAESLHKFRKALGNRFRCALNPFSLGVEKSKAWFDAAGNSVINLSVRLQKNRVYTSLRSEEAQCVDILNVLQDFDFKGTWTIEATQGVGATGEEIDALFGEAEDDLNFLVEFLAKN